MVTVTAPPPILATLLPSKITTVDETVCVAALEPAETSKAAAYRIPSPDSVAKTVKDDWVVYTLVTVNSGATSSMVGVAEGCGEGNGDGIDDGQGDGMLVGVGEGTSVGITDGWVEGMLVGEGDGTGVGTAVGTLVGCEVGI